jgi:hypothetical protein
VFSSIASSSSPALLANAVAIGLGIYTARYAINGLSIEKVL